MRIAVVGGGLQGIEVSYLAQKAGWEVILFDRRSPVPAQGLCPNFVQADVEKTPRLDRLFSHVDLVIPALENSAALARLSQWQQSPGTHTPLAFDMAAYQISACKHTSNQVFARLGLPLPQAWPECSFPVVVKPKGESGSNGVMICHDKAALDRVDRACDPVIQEFITGPSYSIEVIGLPGRYTPFQVTRLEMDKGYDCKRVLAPADLSTDRIKAFERMARTVAQAVGLKGIMDLEVIRHNGQLKLLEIDARFPSQTPMAVYHATGVNLVQALAEIVIPLGARAPQPSRKRFVILEHLQVKGTTLTVAGEHIMKQHGLQVQKNFFGADEAITNYAQDKKTWVATLIVSDAHAEAAWEKRGQVLEMIQAQCCA